ncbi:hypothetical protein UFOVP1528_14 [uncultured Caudovirales phage]|uniref:Uncharacterized protein n=1 Tax=uncultured Caudovirales phage TaxID=2100421 RepID=A0A6J5QQN9_9CAUD|nr:hypothetical protein UFOVP905_13 [uncultured Caudovirales phage]CAB4183308.1 hypothetical protein UFOVP1080_49 [uncultured Caudovirales phage]CAB4197723.1 hypothetical protein UFOVP1321_37 [uncultured Caudovirales phage]CAB4212594.1 hypothetical protein UFOVP1432_26 [uncultured Caudovirales phage]CAB5227209.1 hypothetical protein UFOVP1528_14 [uncultured Caudovirales phage]
MILCIRCGKKAINKIYLACPVCKEVDNQDQTHFSPPTILVSDYGGSSGGGGDSGGGGTLSEAIAEVMKS